MDEPENVEVQIDQQSFWYKPDDGIWTAVAVTRLDAQIIYTSAPHDPRIRIGQRHDI